MASLLTATKRIVGRYAALQIASASAASFFCRLTKAYSNVSRGDQPDLMAEALAQWWALAHASIATRQRGWAAKNDSILSRRSFLRKTTAPDATSPCAWNTFSADVHARQVRRLLHRRSIRARLIGFCFSVLIAKFMLLSV